MCSPFDSLVWILPRIDGANPLDYMPMSDPPRKPNASVRTMRDEHLETAIITFLRNNHEAHAVEELAFHFA